MLVVIVLAAMMMVVWVGQGVGGEGGWVVGCGAWCGAVMVW